MKSCLKKTRVSTGCSLVFKCVSIFLTKIHDKLDNLRCCIRNLNGIGFDVSDCISTFLYLMLQIHHKQSPTLCPMYRGEEVGEGGYVYSEPGMYGNVALLDIASMHPHSAIAEVLLRFR